MNREISKKKLKQDHLFNFDFHLTLTLLFRIWSILAGGLTALMIPSFLGPVHQGYFYTFTALIGTQLFFELGLNHVLVQLTSQAAAHLRHTCPDRIDGDERWRHSIVSLIRLAKNWYAVMAVIFFASLLGGGYLLFNGKGTLPISEWIFAWLIITCSASVNLSLSAQLSISEGLGEVGQIARLRLYQSMIGYSVLWLLLLSEAGLWAAVAVPVTNMLGSTFWLSKRRLTRRLNVLHLPSLDSHYNYRRDVFPLQWRIALSWISGYFTFSFLIPVMFAIQGAIAAGRLGLALSIFNAISTLGMSWISIKIPAFGQLIARNERHQLNELFDRQAVSAIGVTFFLVTLVLVTFSVAGYFEPQIFDRLPPMIAMIILSVATIANVAVFSMSAYMRAHREEPLLANSLVTALLIGAGGYSMAHLGLIPTVSVYGFVIVFIMLPWCSVLFVQYRRRIA